MNINELSPSELGKLFPIRLEQHNPIWEEEYMKEATKIFDALGPVIFRIHHIGSTSVPGLLAKPTIDILVEVGKHCKAESIVNAMKSIQYHHNQKTDLENVSMMFMKGYTINGYEGQAFHIHVRYPKDWDELYFCEYLLNHPDTCREYENIKKDLKEKYEFDREAYTNGKTEFVQNIVSKARELYYPRFEILKNPKSR